MNIAQNDPFLKYKIEIKYLFDYPQLIDPILKSDIEYFGQDYPSSMISELNLRWKKIYENQYSKKKLPITFIALFDNELMGYLSIYKNIRDSESKNPDEEYTESGPLITGLYVFPLYRNKGVARKLLEFTFNTIRNLGYQSLYIMASSEELKKMYERYEFQELYQYYDIYENKCILLKKNL